MKIINFKNYKVFLRDFISRQPKRGRGLIKQLAENLRVNPSQVSQIISGSKDFTEEQAFAAGRYIGLNEIEGEYFLTLVKIERAGTRDLKAHYTKQRDKLREAALDISRHVKQDRILNEYEKSVFYSSYLYSAIRLFTSVGKGKSLPEVCEKFSVSRKRAAEILNFLVEVGLCVETGGVFQMGTQHTHVERGSPFLSRHHHNWRVKALQRTESIGEQELQFTGPFSLGRKEFLLIREILVDTISKSLEHVKSSQPTDVACLNIDWFWLEEAKYE